MNQRRTKPGRWLVLTMVLAAASCSNGPANILSVTGQIEAVSVHAGSRVGGRVSEVLVNEGDAVGKGDVLVRLETVDAQAAVDAAQGQLEQTDAFLRKLRTGARPEQIEQALAAVQRTEEQYRMATRGFRDEEIEAARATVDAARAQRDDAAALVRRLKPLYEEDAVAGQQYDQARHALEAAEGSLRAMQKKYDLVKKGPREEEIAIAKAALDQAQAALDEIQNGARAEDIEAAEAAREAAQAQLQMAESQVREMTIVAPRDGVVESIDIHPGDLVAPGPVMRLIDPEDLELVVYVGAAVLGKLRLNQEVSLTTDSHGDEVFQARIVHLASEGEFTPRNLQTKEERVLQMFGIKLKMDSAGGKLKSGMSATVHFDLTAGDA